MSDMNPINEIFLKTVQLHNAKWYQIIKRLKLVKEINDIQYYLLYTKDIFSFSDEFFTAYCGLSHITRGKYYDQLLIYEDAPLMRIRISELKTFYIKTIVDTAWELAENSKG